MRRRAHLVGAALLVMALAGLSATALASRTHGVRSAVRAHAAAQACAGDRSARDPRNPLDLQTPPGANPLSGARFSVPGPAHGSAAAALASLLGSNPLSYPDSYSWARFVANPVSRLAESLPPGLTRKVRMLEKIASQPEAQRFSAYMHGGTAAGILAQVNKVFCNNLSADPGTVPIINTYFAHEMIKQCTPAYVRSQAPLFRRRIDAMTAGIGNHPAVMLLELDAFGSSGCFASHGSLGDWESLLRYEVNKIAALPHTLVYLEAGYSDSNSAVYTARALNKVGIRHIRGFFTNDTHENWTINEVRWAEKISRMTHGAHYIVNTSENGNGPLRPKNRVKYGNENLCNPPGRALGPRDTTNTGFPHADAFMWTHPPGNSSGCGGGPAGGVFWPARAIGLADRANARLGPHYPSRPY